MWWTLVVPMLLAANIAAFTICQAVGGPDEHVGDHGYGHAEFHDWYKGLAQPDNPKASCCSNEDCRPTETRVRGETIEAKIDGKWYPIPPEKILKKAAPDLGSHICAPQYSKYYGSEESYPKGYIYCAIIGNGV